MRSTSFEIEGSGERRCGPQEAAMGEEVLMATPGRVAYQGFLDACDERILRDARHLGRLQGRLARSRDSARHAGAPEAAQLHSRVRLRDLSSGKTQIETVVVPAAEEVLAGRRPLDSWIGPLLLGARVGDEIRWLSGDAIRRWRIEEILAADANSSLPRRVVRRQAHARRSGPAAYAHNSTTTGDEPEYRLNSP
jgi:GreA/GreB family transcription elongation factor